MGKFLFILIIILLIFYMIFKFVIYNILFLFFLKKTNTTTPKKRVTSKLQTPNFFKRLYINIKAFCKKVVFYYFLFLKKYIKKNKKKNYLTEFYFKNFTSFSVISFDGIFIQGKYFIGKLKSCIIFTKDFNSTDEENYSKLQYFLDKGYSVVYYYNRAEYTSDGDYYTHGFLEKYDLNKIVEWSKLNISGVKKIILYGEKSGAIVTSLYVNEWSDVDAIILENCIESYLETLKNYFYRFHLPHSFSEEILNNFLEYCYKFFGVDISQISPIYSLMRQNTKVILYVTDSKYLQSHKNINDFRNTKNFYTYSYNSISEVEKQL